MAPSSLLYLPEELLWQILGHLSKTELCQSARVNGLLNMLCEQQIYRNVPVIRYAYSHSGETDHDAIRCFFNAIKKRPQRLSYIREVNARLELRIDMGLHRACELFESLPKMPHLTDLCLEIVGGVKPHRENRALEQAMISGATFERGRMAVYKFFRRRAEREERGGLHALHNLRRLRVIFPRKSIGLQTDLMAYSALQHESITSLNLRYIVNATLAPPKLPRPLGAITDLSMQSCQLPLMAYQSIFRSISALEHLDYRPAQPTGSLPPGGLVEVLAHHRDSLRSLSIKVDENEMTGMNLSTFHSLTHLQIHNLAWTEDAMRITGRSIPGDSFLPAALPPSLQVLTLSNFHTCGYIALMKWLGTIISPRNTTILPTLKEIHLEAENLAYEYEFDSDPMYEVRASAFHLNKDILDVAKSLRLKLGVTLFVRTKLFYELGSYYPGPYDTGPKAMALDLNWKYRTPSESGDKTVTCAEMDMYPKGAIEKLLFLKEDNHGSQLSLQDL